MKITRIQFSLLLAVILIFTLLSTSALAAAGKLDVAAKPVCVNEVSGGEKLG